MMENTLPSLMTVSELSSALRIGRTKTYALLKSGAIQHINIGKSIRIPQKYYLDYLTQLEYNGDRVDCTDVIKEV